MFYSLCIQLFFLELKKTLASPIMLLNISPQSNFSPGRFCRIFSLYNVTIGLKSHSIANLALQYHGCCSRDCGCILAKENSISVRLQCFFSLSTTHVVWFWIFFCFCSRINSEVINRRLRSIPNWIINSKAHKKYSTGNGKWIFQFTVPLASV